MSHYIWHEETLLIYCHIKANAADNSFAELLDKRLKVRISAPATNGAANKCLIKYLAAEFGVPKSRIELLKGPSSPYKTIAIKAPEKIPTHSFIIRP